ncbi:MAG: BatA domain-containing protein [Kiritimatiellaeota bacterium]|nr:BatA domain-containing protein [Kiritimatiellota bacterium]
MVPFVNPIFLWALAAAAIPLMLHMFQRRRTVVTPFPTLRFLKAAQRRSSSRVRFENFLLWLLRTLLVVTIALAFAVPVLRSSTNDSSLLTRSNRDIAIILDASYSMNYELERAKVWDICKETAVRIVNGLLHGDRVCVFLASETPETVIEMTTEHATVAQAIRSRETMPKSSRLDEAIKLAVNALEQQKDPREKEIYVLTDGQALPWHGFRDAMGQEQDASAAGAAATKNNLTPEQRNKISLFILAAGAQYPDNACPFSVKVTPNLLLAGQTARVNVSVARSGPAKQLTVGLEVDGQNRGRRDLMTEADTASSVEFIVGGLEPGVHIAKVTTPQDALPEDDTFLFLLRVRQQLPALVVGPHESTRFLKAALAPGAADDSIRQVEPEELDGVDLRDFQAVFLCDAFPLSGQAVIKIEEYVKTGGVAIVFPGDRADASAYSGMSILPAQPQEIENVPIDFSTRQLRRVPPQQEQVVVFSMNLPAGTIPTLALKRVQSFGALTEGAAVLITAVAGANETPFMLGRAFGRGRIFQFAVGADREWSSLPITAFFLPIVHQLIRLGAGAAIQPPSVYLGSNILVNESIPNYREDDIITGPSGAILPIKDSGNRTFVIEELTEPGIYLRAKGGGEPEPVLAVNADRTESYLAPATVPQLHEWTGFRRLITAQDPDELLRQIEEYRNGRQLTELFFWLALILSLIEWWYANRILRQKTGAIEKMSVDLAGKVVIS